MSWLWSWLPPVYHHIAHSWQYGDVPGWIESLATGAAFIIVAVTLRMQLSDRRSEQASNIDFVVWAAEPSMARPVFTRAGDAPPEKKWPRRVLGLEAENYHNLYVTIFNSSRTAVNDVLFSVSTKDGQEPKTVSIGKVPPGEHTCRYDSLDPTASGKPGLEPSLLIPLVQFRDQSGRLWQRSARGDLTAIRKVRQELPKPSQKAQLNP
jgi:hypothetical protein